MSRDSQPNTAPPEGRPSTDLAPGIPRAPVEPAGGRSGRVRTWSSHLPFLQIAVYYALLVGLVLLLTDLFPELRRAFFMPIDLPAVSGSRELLTGTEPVRPPVLSESAVIAQAVDRAATTLLVTLGALLLVLPVAWVYMRTKRLRYDPALVTSVIILPIVVAGIALVVKNSIALAFSLAGIVAAVRFRNTLKDPRDAVYIFLVIGIGLSAGVQALDVAMVMSMIFNFVVLVLWRFNVGSIYGGSYGRTGVISTGNRSLLLAQDPARRRAIRRGLLPEAEAVDTDGILLVHTATPELARGAVQESLQDVAKEWRLARIAPRGSGHSTLEYVVQLKKKSSPSDLIGALEERWSQQVAAAEYFSFLTREHPRYGEDGADSDDDTDPR